MAGGRGWQGWLGALVAVAGACAAPPERAIDDWADAVAFRVTGGAPQLANVRGEQVRFQPGDPRATGRDEAGAFYLVAPGPRDVHSVAVLARLFARGGQLWWDGHPLTLPPGIAMREVWDAVRVHGWVVGLGRTSRSDREAALVPPFFASEGFAFRPERGVVHLSDVLGAFPPGDDALTLLRQIAPAQNHAQPD